MTEKQKYAIKLAIDTMDKYISRYWNTSYGSCKTGVAVGYGEAISILSDMLSNADNHTCNCQHNSSSRDNEPCCRCDSKNTNTGMVKVDSLEIIVRMIDDKPYYEVKYKEVGEDDYCIGYSSYDLKIILGYIDTYFEIVENDRQTNADRIRNMSDEELLDFICSIETYGEGSVMAIKGGAAMCSVTEVEEWLQSEAE